MYQGWLSNAFQQSRQRPYLERRYRYEIPAYLIGEKATHDGSFTLEDDGHPPMGRLSVGHARNHVRRSGHIADPGLSLQNSDGVRRPALRRW